MKNEGIIPGYHGIMDLDVSNMDPRYIKQAIEQHENDIKIYTAEQAKLKPEHRYENTIMRIDKQRAYISMKEKAYLDAIDKAALDRNIQSNNSK
tara:strand:- start:1492 stop:1773 length:282 start_codon:yes stop_codon:yes gene_type:complete